MAYELLDRIRSFSDVRALERGGFRSAVMEAVIAAYEKNLELKMGT